MTAAVNYPEGRKSLMSHWETGRKALLRPLSLLSSGTEIDIFLRHFLPISNTAMEQSNIVLSARRAHKSDVGFRTAPAGVESNLQWLNENTNHSFYAPTKNYQKKSHQNQQLQRDKLFWGEWKIK
jgi:hypothetical protein